jgi:hypothetical protein
MDLEPDHRFPGGRHPAPTLPAHRASSRSASKVASSARVSVFLEGVSGIPRLVYLGIEGATDWAEATAVGSNPTRGPSSTSGTGASRTSKGSRSIRGGCSPPPTWTRKPARRSRSGRVGEPGRRIGNEAVRSLQTRRSRRPRHDHLASSKAGPPVGALRLAAVRATAGSEQRSLGL